MRSALDQHLIDNGFSVDPDEGMLEGYVSESQKLQFCERLKTYPPIQKMAEIGLNAGHSAENFLISCPELKRFVSFDLCFYKYTDLSISYLQKTYEERFHFVKGDSKSTIVQYAENHPNETFDLIYIDGDHRHAACTSDIINCAKLSKPETILWIDDYHYLSVFLSVHEQEHLGLIQILHIHDSQDPKAGQRSWVEAKYLKH